MTTRNKLALPALNAGASLIALALLTGCGDSNQPDTASNSATALMSSSSALNLKKYAVEIRRTSHGIPHIRALDEGSLGFGVGFAYAQDNFCQLADEMVTVNSERSKYFGGDATGGNPALTNVQTDYFYQLINDPASVATAWQKQPADMRALVEGYVAGYNHYLEKTGVANLPAECRNAAWVRKLGTSDMMKLIRRYAVEAGAGQFIAEIVGAAPPGAAATASSSSLAKASARNLRPATKAEHPMTPAYWKKMHTRTGSNAVALGRDASANGQGLLLSNPHFPWQGALRFYQVHLTIPGKLDAMGASLGGMPMVNIGFNQNLAWGHTVNTSAHFTSYVLNLDPGSPTRYYVDGQPQEMSKRTVSIQVKGADGVIRTESRDFYSTPNGMAMVIPGMLEWSSELAYTVRDANLDNHRMLEQWSAMNRATSLSQFKSVIERTVGLPWVNTIAADNKGNTLYMDVTVVPNVSKEQQAMCVPEPFKPLAAQGLFVLSGAYSACNWGNDPSAPQKGIFAGKNLPTLSRSDFVQNSNDSAWMSNPKAPLTGFPDIVSIDSTELSGRTRIGIGQLQSALNGKRLSMDGLQSLVLNNRVYYADQTVDDLLGACNGSATADDGSSVDLTGPCAQLAAWDRTANLDAGIGLAYFTGLWERVRYLPNLWQVPFNPLDPANTPRKLNVNDPEAGAIIKAALASAVIDAQLQGWTASTRLGDVQGTMRGDRWIPIHGANGDLGVYNAIESFPVAPGVREVLYGSSYMQTVGFSLGGPQAKALLTYSQSSNPASPYYADQTELFSRKQWVTLPFNEWQILTDPAYKTTIIVK